MFIRKLFKVVKKILNLHIKQKNVYIIVCQMEEYIVNVYKRYFYKNLNLYYNLNYIK